MLNFRDHTVHLIKRETCWDDDGGTGKKAVSGGWDLLKMFFFFSETRTFLGQLLFVHRVGVWGLYTAA